MALAEFLCQSYFCCHLDPRLHRPSHLQPRLLDCARKKLKVVYFCLQVAGTQVLKEAGKPVRVAESDVDVSPSMSFTCPSHVDLNMMLIKNLSNYTKTQITFIFILLLEMFLTCFQMFGHMTNC